MSSAWRLAGALAIAGGCAAPYGPLRAGLPEPPKDAVAIVVVGGAADEGSSAPHTAKALADVLAHARTADKDAVVVLPGGYAPKSAKADAPVVREVARATPRVGTRFAVRGGDESGHGAIRPVTNAVVRIGSDGRGETISRCEKAKCTVAKPDSPGVVDLVFVDLAPWWAATPETPAAIARLGELLGALDPADTTPRILVLAEPVEGAFERGAGAQRGRQATFHVLPPVLREAIAAGVFVGVVAGDERSVHATADLTAAIKRSDRVWLTRPVWQVVAGNATDPVAGRDGRRSLWRRGTVYQPDLASFRAGFAVVWIHGETATLDVVARRGKQWHSGRLALPLRPAPTREPAGIGHLAPCPRCQDFPATDRP